MLEVMAGVPVIEVADRYGVSRQSVHAWLRRYRDQGPPGLADRSHKVHAHPWQIPAELESAVCELRRAHRKWGPKRLVFEMGRRGLGAVTRSTVYRVLVRNQLIEPRSRRRRRQDYVRWEHIPEFPSATLHNAACHACLFASETSCEAGNRWLDRAILVNLTGDGLAFALS